MIPEQKKKKKKKVIGTYILPSIKACSDLYTVFRLELGPLIQHVQMYPSSTTEIVKEKKKRDLSDPNRNIRILIATCTAGMGVNFASIKGMIHFGPPKDMDTFMQQTGRSGGQATAILLLAGAVVKHSYLSI